MDVWREVAEARVLLASEVDRLDEDALSAPSWCAGWRVRDVLGHLVYLAEATQLGVARDVVRFGPKPDRALDRRARMLGTPAVVALGAELVHGADMLPDRA